MRTLSGLLLLSGIGVIYPGCNGEVAIAALPDSGAGDSRSGSATGAGGGSSGGTPAGPSGTPSCTVNGVTYLPGEGFWADCNSCTCNSDGSMTCTAILCLDRGDASPEGGDSPEAQAPPPASPACANPAGPVQTFASVSEVYAAMEGLWQICPGSVTFFGAPADTIGIEYGQASSAPTANGSTVGGLMYYLIQGPSGPVRGQGFNYQLTYDVSPEGSAFQLNMHPMPNSGFGGSFRYSASPRQFEIDGGSVAPAKTWILVPFN